MKARVITGVVGIPVAALIIMFAPPIVLNIAMSAICAVAIYELLKATGHNSNYGIVMFAVLYAVSAPFFRTSGSLIPAFAITFVYAFCLCVLQIRHHETLKVEDVAFSFFSTIMYSISFSCISYLFVLGENEYGRFYVALGLIMPWMSDMGAYFVGTFFGKKKLAPKISPKKTVEGLIGGIVTSIVVSVLAAVLYQKFWLKDAATLNYILVGVLSIICAPLSVLGDLFASVMKRQYGAKDYGNIFPGHGGVMDRFDSLLFCMPFLYLFLLFQPIIK